MKRIALSTIMLLFFSLLTFKLAHAAAPTGEFRMAVGSLSNEVLDPIAGATDNKWYLTLLYDSLVGMDSVQAKLSNKNGIAERWENSADYKSWTFYLRKAVKFHNGVEVTADDVKFSIERALGPSSVSTNRTSLEKVIDKVDIIDQYTIRISCKAPDSLLAMSLSELIGTEGMIVPKKYIEEKGEQYFRLHPIGTGICKLKEYIPGKSLSLETVDGHFAYGTPRYKAVKLLIASEATARIGSLQRAEIDVTQVPLERVKEIKNLGFPVLIDPGQGTHIINFNDTWNKEYSVSDIRVREALNISIDRKEMHQALFGGLGDLALYPIAVKVSIGYEQTGAPYPYDAEKAKRLLQDAGYGKTNPCPITIYSCPVGGFPESQQIVEMLSSYWTEVGFKVDIISVPEFTVVRKKAFEHTIKGGMFPNTIGGRMWAMPITRVLCHSEGPLVAAKIPELDKAIDQALSEIDPEKRATLANKALQLVYSNYLHIPLIEAPGVFAVNPKSMSDWSNWNMGPVVFDYNLRWAIFH